MNLLRSRTARVVAVVLIQFGIVGLAVADQLSARLTGEEYQFRVEPLDPHDPFRGAYVTLSYPDLQPQNSWSANDDGEVFLPLRKKGEFWTATRATQKRPVDGPYLTCTENGGSIDCGIDSWFVPQDKATALEDAIRKGEVVARVKIDDRGHAALVAVQDP